MIDPIISTRTRMYAASTDPEDTSCLGGAALRPYVTTHLMCSLEVAECLSAAAPVQKSHGRILLSEPSRVDGGVGAWLAAAAAAAPRPTIDGERGAVVWPRIPVSAEAVEADGPPAVAHRHQLPWGVGRSLSAGFSSAASSRRFGFRG
jgi:hypothetical protein